MQSEKNTDDNDKQNMPKSFLSSSYTLPAYMNIIDNNRQTVAKTQNIISTILIANII